MTVFLYVMNGIDPYENIRQVCVKEHYKFLRKVLAYNLIEEISIRLFLDDYIL